MNNEEIDDKDIEHETSVADAIVIENASFRWGINETTVLENVDLQIPKGSLTAVSLTKLIFGIIDFCKFIHCIHIHELRLCYSFYFSSRLWEL